MELDSQSLMKVGIFVFALTMGTCSTLSSKVMFEITSVDSWGEERMFKKPLMQTFLMFVAMVIALPCQKVWEKSRGEESKSLPWTTYTMLMMPAITDMSATALSMIGLQYVTVSVYQLIRSMVIVFVALLKYFVLKFKLSPHMWAGVMLNVIAISLVSCASLFDASAGNDVLKGILIMLGSCFIMSLQFVLEEKLMGVDGEGAPPLVIVGYEGFWGALAMVIFVFPLAYYLPGADHGRLENFFDTWVMIGNSGKLQFMTVFYILSITGFNISAIFVTFFMDSVWRSILANFRPIAVWVADLALYYFFTHGAFGEPWTIWSWLQLIGMAFLLFGTAVYNASIKLPGFDYSGLDNEEEVAEMDSERIFSSPLIQRTNSQKSPYTRIADGEKYGSYGTNGDAQGRKSIV